MDKESTKKHHNIFLYQMLIDETNIFKSLLKINLKLKNRTYIVCRVFLPRIQQRKPKAPITHIAFSRCIRITTISK